MNVFFTHLFGFFSYMKEHLNSTDLLYAAYALVSIVFIGKSVKKILKTDSIFGALSCTLLRGGLFVVFGYFCIVHLLLPDAFG